jgi:hypothetical protein
MPTSYRIRGSRSKQGLQRSPTSSLFFISLFFIFIFNTLKGRVRNPIEVRFPYKTGKIIIRSLKVYKVWRKWYLTPAVKNSTCPRFCFSPRPYITRRNAPLIVDCLWCNIVQTSAG